MINRLLIPLAFLSSWYLLSMCARQTAPTGGPKDTIPPKVQVSIPRANQTNFRGNEVLLTFDEFVALDNPKQKIIITPDVNNKYEIKARKKTVTLIFEEPLKENTTYAINFLESVKDITEKNPANNLRLAFSTGDYIDSLDIQGVVLDATTRKEIKNATVALYQQDTFSIFQHKPSYLTKTDDKGLYALQNLKPGAYYLYAFSDANKNLIVDSKSESYAFTTKPLELSRNVKTEPLSMIRLDSRPLKMTSARPYNSYYNIKLSKGILTYSLKQDIVDSLYSITADNNTSIKIFNTFSQDSLPINLRATDSLHQTLDTTLYVKFLTKRSTPETFGLTLANWTIEKERAIIEGSVRYSKPIEAINFDSIYYVVDTLNRITFTPTDISIDKNRQEIRFRKSFDKTLFKASTANPSSEQRPKQSPTKSPTTVPEQQIVFATASFISVEADTSTTLAETVKPLGLEDTGILKVNIQTEEPNYILQLLDKSFNVIKQARNRSTVSFEYIKPGDYFLRLIIDRDNNGFWSPGNILKGEPTEDVVFYQSEKKTNVVNLKANWELGPLLISY